MSALITFLLLAGKVFFSFVADLEPTVLSSESRVLVFKDQVIT